MIGIIKSIVANKLKIIGKPRFVTFIVTWKCNCKCTMCDIWKRSDTGLLSIDEIKRFFSQIPKLDAIRITGGEPTLRKDLPDLINTVIAASHPSIVHLTTNGLLTDFIVDTVKRISEPFRLHLKVSIDAFGDEHDRIRGVSGAFDNAVKSVERLNDLRKSVPFYLGIDQTLVDKNGMRNYEKLSALFGRSGIQVYPVMAYEKSVPLYSAASEGVSDNSPEYRTFGQFTATDLKDFLEKLFRDTRKIRSVRERLVKRYYLKGLYNRLILNTQNPNPSCVALHNHLRILPNGDIPVCLYNNSIIGNAGRESLHAIWHSAKSKKQRAFVRKCSGCWPACESIVNAVYSGDIWRGITGIKNDRLSG